MEQISPIQPPPPLQELAGAAPLALFLDFDGTLVEIAATPGGIDVPRDLARRLEALARRIGGRLALVSGRSLDDLAHHLGAVAIARAGSHGVDRRGADGAAFGPVAAPLPPAALAEIATFAAVNLALHLETKSHGAALHFRAAPELADRAIAFAEELAGRFDLKTKHGKSVVELVHPEADKAGAVGAFMAEAPFAGAVPVFIGDDITDEDGFRAARQLGGFGIIVGGRPETAAQYRLADPSQLYRWLEL